MTAEEDRAELIELAGEALTALVCPARPGRQGVCATGCWEEPLCQVNEPTGGWEQQLREAAEGLMRLSQADPVERDLRVLETTAQWIDPSSEAPSLDALLAGTEFGYTLPPPLHRPPGEAS